MLWYLLFEHLWKTPPYRKKLHPKSEKKILQISQLFFGCCRLVKYLIFQFTFIFYELYWFLRWKMFLSCGIKQSMIDNCSFRPLQMYLEYLNTDKMRSSSWKSIWNIWTLIKWEAKLLKLNGTRISLLPLQLPHIALAAMLCLYYRPCRIYTPVVSLK